jgi:hypothetical protein
MNDDDPLVSRLRALPHRKMDDNVAARVRLKARAMVVEQSNAAPQGFFARLQVAYFRAIEPALVLGTVGLGLAYAVASVNGIIH